MRASLICTLSISKVAIKIRGWKALEGWDYLSFGWRAKSDFPASLARCHSSGPYRRAGLLQNDWAKSANPPRSIGNYRAFCLDPIPQKRCQSAQKRCNQRRIHAGPNPPSSENEWCGWIWKITILIKKYTYEINRLNRINSPLVSFKRQKGMG